MILDRRRFLVAAAALSASAPLGATSRSPAVFAHGGGPFHPPSHDELRRLSGGAKTIHICPYSGEDWQTFFQAAENRFDQGGFDKVQLVPLTSIAAFQDAVAAAQIIWFSGGDQSLQMQRLRALPGATDLLKQAHQRGVVMGGSSAGAAVMSDLMISGGSDGRVDTGRGLGFLPNMVLDQHLVTRQREYRLTKVITENPHLIGLGINEETSVTVQNGRVKALGLGPVIVTQVKDGRLQETRMEDGDQLTLG